MPYRDLEPVSKQLTIVVGLTVVGFMAFGLALSFYRNVLFEETLKQLSAQNDELRRQNAVSQDDLEYYRSAQFRDKYAKESLGKIRPGEKALVILTASKTPVLDSEVHDTVTEQQQAAFEALLRTMPVIEHWQLYLFHKDRIDDLKQSL